jgi:hypothetical protein
VHWAARPSWKPQPAVVPVSTTRTLLLSALLKVHMSFYLKTLPWKKFSSTMSWKTAQILRRGTAFTVRRAIEHTQYTTHPTVCTVGICSWLSQTKYIVLK